GFDPQWLVDEIIKRGGKRRLMFRLLMRVGVAKFVMTRATDSHWVRVIEMVRNKVDPTNER
ncbi:MAG: hypothetical protein ACRD68_10135, partial [Pyrinomonadaceae bacterium]